MLIACSACRLQYDGGDLEPGAKVRCFCGELCTVPRPVVREAPAMHCSNCGGRIEGGARTCAYCSAEIAYADRGLGELCPECFARLVKDARYCSGCGVAIRPESVLRALQSLACPRCEGTLTLCSSAGRQLTECTSCGGVWLDAATFERVSKERAQAAAAGAIPTAPEGTAPKPVSEPSVRYLKCPACKDMMVRKNFSGSSGVILDWCRNHGYWFDTHELEAILRFIDAGGVEDARRREHERRVQELARRSPELGPLPRARPSLADVLADFLSGAF